MASHVDAAGEGDDGDGIPWDEPLELVNILNASAVVRTNAWKDVGLELGLEKHVLDRIDRECRGLINDCKREMFSYWLKNDQPSWDKVSGAVKRARRRLEAAIAREESRRHIQEMEYQLLKSLQVDTTRWIDGASHQLSSTFASTTADVLGKPFSLNPSQAFYVSCI